MSGAPPRPTSSDRHPLVRLLGVAGGLAGLGASLLVLTGSLSGIDWLLGQPRAQFALFAWPVVMGAVSAIGLAASWRHRVPWMAAAAAALAVFSLMGLLSIGPFYIPAAVLLAVAAIVDAW